MSRRSAVDRVAPRANSTTEAFLQHLDDQRCILSSVALAVKEVARLFGALVGLKVSDSRGESLVLGVSVLWNHFAIDKVLCEEQNVAHGFLVAATGELAQVDGVSSLGFRSRVGVAKGKC